MIDYKELEAEKYWSFPKAYKGDKKLETKNMLVYQEVGCTVI